MAYTAFRGMKPFSQLMFALFVMLVSVLFFLVAGMLIAVPFYGTEVLTNSLSASGMESPESIKFLKYFQVLQSVGLFVIPPFIIAWLYHGDIQEYLYLNKNTRLQNYLLAALSLLFVIPFINFLGAINSQMSFPDSLSGIEIWMRSMEDSAKILVEKFMQVDGISGLLFNVFMIAVIPALGEELMFRGVVQKIFVGWTRNHHWGIWISAFLFSAMHMQFYGFLPRMALGAMFGYLLVWTGTMWIPILAHFVNNLMGVLGYFMIHKGIINNDVEEIGIGQEQIPVVILSISLVGFLLFMIYRSQHQETKMPANQEDSQASRID
jgi:membrane protease YdiL (CAAX protease family)